LGADVVYQPRVENPGSETWPPEAETCAELCTFQPLRRTVCPPTCVASKKKEAIAEASASSQHEQVSVEKPRNLQACKSEFRDGLLI
jgi:hypothetical protein